MAPHQTPVFRVIVAPGHGLSNAHNGVFDSGAVGPDGMTEAAVVSQVGMEVLADMDDPPEVTLVPVCSSECVLKHPKHADGSPTNHLEWTVHWLNERYYAPFDLIIALHMNDAASEQASGVEVYYSKDAPEGRAAEAQGMCEAISDVLGIPCRGAHPSNASQHSSLAILDRTKARAFLIEIGFQSNCNDVRIVRERGAAAVIHGIRTLPGVPQPKKEH